jgi:hypothetical protein
VTTCGIMAGSPRAVGRLASHVANDSWASQLMSNRTAGYLSRLNRTSPDCRACSSRTPNICSFVEMSVIRYGRSGHPALRGDNGRPGLPVLPRTVISAATSRCRYGACLVGGSRSRPAPGSGMPGSRAAAFWWPPRPRPFAPGLTPQIPDRWGHAAGPPLLRITATVIKVTEVRSQIRTTSAANQDRGTALFRGAAASGAGTRVAQR